MKRALTYRLFEALNIADNTTEGLSEFIQTIYKKFPKYLTDKEGVLQDLANFIINSGCPKIRFDNLYGALGISKTDECVIGNSSLNSGIANLLYVILHEVAHQYQYSKYGKDVVWDAYNSKIDMDKATDLLMNIEMVADRLAFLKANSILKNNDVKSNRPIKPFYTGMSKDYFKNYLSTLREEVKKRNFSSIEDVNEYIYNKLKTKPAIQTYSRSYTRPSIDFKNQSQIDKILDKLSADGWSSLTEPEKNTLRSASKKTDAPQTKEDPSQLDLF